MGRLARKFTFSGVIITIMLTCSIARSQERSDFPKQSNNTQALTAEDQILQQSLSQIMNMPVGHNYTQEEISRYTLGPADVIQVSVLRHPEVSGNYIINHEGKIQYEFVGDIEISGLTKDEAAMAIGERLSEYIVSPETSVKITGYNSKVVYVVGEVYRPGKIFMRGDTITIREALVQAGLPALTGKTRKSHLITPDETGKVEKKYVDVYALIYEGDLRENHVMKPGDVVYIPPTFLTKAMRMIQPVATPIGTAAGTGRAVTTGF